MANAKPDKNAMARALGAAFLSHQVQELEKTVSAKPRFDGSRGRDRRGSRGGQRPQQQSRGGGRPLRMDEPRGEFGRRSNERDHSSERDDREDKTQANKKDAEVVVVDASVLVHALGQLKTWCRNGREEIIVVPLEALNTLDLLKKGTSPLAQRARAASRMLEQQVGTNPRIKVQRDEAYVLWDNIPFHKADSDVEGDAVSEDKHKLNTPEWVRRTICCARWEFDQLKPAESELKSEEPAPITSNDAKSTVSSFIQRSESPPPVIVAVCLETAQLPDATSASSPVPLPVPYQASKHEQRCTGALVAQWAKEAGIPVVEYTATPLPMPPSSRRGPPPHARTPSDDEPVNYNQSPNRIKPMTIKMKSGSPFSGDKSPFFGPGRAGGALVERPAATMVMNDVVQLSKPIRLLARGEKLDP